MGNLIKLAVEKPVTTFILMCAALILGLFIFTRVPMDMFPDIQFPVCAIITEYEGTGPEEIEESITKQIERVIGTVDNIKNITSTSMEGVSMVVVEFNWGADLINGAADIREKISLIEDYLPDNAKKPMVIRFDVSMMPIMRLGVYGSADQAYLKEIAEDKIADRLEQVEGVASANVSGGLIEVVKIELNRNRMEAYQLGVSDIVNILRMENVNTPTGEVYDGSYKYTMKVFAKFKSIEEIRNTVVTVKGGQAIRLQDVAHSVGKAYKEKNEIVHINGKDGISITIQKQSGMNTVQTVKKVYKRLEKIKKEIPKEIEITAFFDQAEFINKSIANVATVALQGGILTIIVLFLFLRNFRSVGIIAVSIPFSIIVSFIFLYFKGISLNIISMSGMALGIGMMVDSSIVVLENIFTFRERGSRRLEAASLGTKEVVLPIVASTITTLCVFLPIFLVEANMAVQMFKEMAWTVIFVLSASLIVSVTVIPMLCSKFLRITHFEPYTPEKITEIKKQGIGGSLELVYHKIVISSEAVLNWLDEKYSRLIKWALHKKVLVILTITGSFVVSIVLFALVLGKEFMPTSDEARLRFDMKLPLGTNLETTYRYAEKVEDFIMKNMPEARVVNLTCGTPSNAFMKITGSSGDHIAQFFIRLSDVSTRQAKGQRDYKQLMEFLRTELQYAIPGAEFNFDAGGGFMSGNSKPLEIEIRGPSLKQGQKYAEQIKKIVKNVKGTRNVQISRETGLPEQRIIINRRKAALFGINSFMVSQSLKQYVTGTAPTRYVEKGKEIDIFVRLRKQDRQTLKDIKKLKIPTPTGALVPLENFAKIVPDTGPAKIERKNQERIITVSADTFDVDTNTVNQAVQDRIAKLQAPKNFTVSYGGSFKDMQEGFFQLAIALVLAVMLVYSVMAAQFESFLDPFIIIFSVPLSFIGVFLIHLVTFTNFSVVSLIGQLMLAGIVVNNAIILIDYMNLLRKRGASLYEAAIQAGRRRLRPILMTTLTTVLGLIPMSLGMGESGELFSPLARSMAGGLTVATVLTLVFIPILYVLFNKRHEQKRLQSEHLYSVTR